MDITSGALATLGMGVLGLIIKAVVEYANGKQREGEFKEWKKHVDDKINSMPATTKEVSGLTTEFKLLRQTLEQVGDLIARNKESDDARFRVHEAHDNDRFDKVTAKIEAKSDSLEAKVEESAKAMERKLDILINRFGRFMNPPNS